MLLGQLEIVHFGSAFAERLDAGNEPVRLQHFAVERAEEVAPGHHPQEPAVLAVSTTGSCPRSRNQSFSLTLVSGSVGVTNGISESRSSAITRLEMFRSGSDSLMSCRSTTPSRRPSSSPTYR